MNRKWYFAKDIKKYLGVTSTQLFHWGQTWSLIKPKIKAEGRAYKDKYQFVDLLDIALIKELTELGFEPSKIKHILKPFNKPDAPKKWRGRIWNFYKDGREDYEEFNPATDKSDTMPGYDNAGCLIFLGKSEGEYSLYNLGRNNEVLGFFKHAIENLNKVDAPKISIIIDLRRIIHELEEITGERL